MARVRTVKPEFWTDRRVGECSPSARLLFIATWNFADDEGGLDRSAKQLKAQAFPYDNLDCEPLVQELLNAGLLIEYEVGGDKYLHIKNFRKHQRIDKPQKARIPIFDPATIVPRTFQERSETIHGSKGMEGNRREEEGEKNPSASATPTNSKSVTVSVSRETDPEWFLDFKLAYPPRAGDQGWRKAQRAANERMREGHAPIEFVEGAKRYAEFCKLTGKLDTEFVKQAATFLGPDKPFLQPWSAPATKADNRLSNNLSAAEEFMRRTEVTQ